MIAKNKILSDLNNIKVLKLLIFAILFNNFMCHWWAGKKETTKKLFSYQYRLMKKNQTVKIQFLFV